MAQTTATKRGAEQASGKEAIRPFHVNFPEAENVKRRPPVAIANRRDRFFFVAFLHRVQFEHSPLLR